MRKRKLQKKKPGCKAATVDWIRLKVGAELWEPFGLNSFFFLERKTLIAIRSNIHQLLPIPSSFSICLVIQAIPLCYGYFMTCSGGQFRLSEFGNDSRNSSKGNKFVVSKATLVNLPKDFKVQNFVLWKEWSCLTAGVDSEQLICLYGRARQSLWKLSFWFHNKNVKYE